MRLLDLFLSFLKIGSIAYGGGPAMIPVIQTEVVDTQGWIPDEDFRTALAIGYSLPGPISSKMALWSGLQVAGIPGAFVAWIALELPSLTIMLIFTRFFWSTMSTNAYFTGAAKGASIGVVGLLAYLVYNQAGKIFQTGNGWLQGVMDHPSWVVLVIVVFVLSAWRPTLMVPLSLIGSAVFGAFFLR